MINKHHKKQLLASILGASSLSVGANSLVLDEIVVTAQREVESVQEIPVTVNAISGEKFNDTVQFDIRDLGKLTPGLTLNTAYNTQNVTLRGVGTKISASQAPRTNIYVDGAYIPSQPMAFFGQYDLERFEVLRGPQGTLYGKPSPTGTIISHTRNPDLSHYEGYVQQTLGEYDLSNTQFGISIPIIENELGVRISGFYDENNNQDFNYYEGSDPLARTESIRTVFLYEPSGPFSARLNYNYTELTSDVPLAISETTDNRYGINIDTYDRIALHNTRRDIEIEANQAVLEMNYQLGSGYFTYLAYYGEALNQSNGLDVDGTPIDFINRDTTISYSRLFNNEIRFTYDDSDFWNWIVGAYYESVIFPTTNIDNRDIVVNFGGWRSGRTSTSINASSSTGRNDIFGVFTHNTIYLSDDWTLTAGLRWNRERTVSYLNGNTLVSIPAIGLDNFVQPLQGFDFVDQYNDVTGTLKLAYTLSPDEMLYLTVDHGGRNGGNVIDPSGSTPLELSFYKPENSTSYELGYKSDWPELGMRLNTTAYYQLYKNYQMQFNDVPIGLTSGGVGGFNTIVNADKVISSGLEVDVTYLLSEQLSTGLSLAYNDTKFDDFSDAPCDSGTVLSEGKFSFCDLSGQRTGGDTGNWSIVGNINYATPSDFFQGEWYFDALINFASKRIAPSTGRESPSYTTVDIFGGVRADQWDVKVWVKNIFDEEAETVSDKIQQNVANLALVGNPFTDGDTSTIPSGVTPHDLLINPRQLGVTGTYRF